MPAESTLSCENVAPVLIANRAVGHRPPSPDPLHETLPHVLGLRAAIPPAVGRMRTLLPERLVGERFDEGGIVDEVADDASAALLGGKRGGQRLPPTHLALVQVDRLGRRSENELTRSQNGQGSEVKGLLDGARTHG